MSSAKSPCTLRSVRWSDFDDLVENYYGCYEERERGEPIGITLFAERPTMAEEAAWFSGMFARIQGGGALARVAEVDGHAVALCQVNPKGPLAFEAGHVGDLGILVRRGYRRRGIGEALLREVLEACRGRFEVIALAVFSTNAGAIHLYRKLGFRPYGKFPREVKRAGVYIDTELMLLELPRSSPGIA